VVIAFFSSAPKLKMGKDSLKTKTKINKMMAIDKNATDEIIFSARNSESLNCFFRLSFEKLVVDI
jgi:hypothetical protein